MASPEKILPLLILLIPLKLTPQCAVLAGAPRGHSFPGFNLPATIICFSVWLAKDVDAMATALCEGSWHSSPVLLQPCSHTLGTAGLGKQGRQGREPGGTGGTWAERSPDQEGAEMDAVGGKSLWQP